MFDHRGKANIVEYRGITPPELPLPFISGNDRSLNLCVLSLKVTYAVPRDGRSAVADVGYCFQSIPREVDEWRCHSTILWDKQVTAPGVNAVRYCLVLRNGKWFQRIYIYTSLRRIEKLASD